MLGFAGVGGITGVLCTLSSFWLDGSAKAAALRSLRRSAGAGRLLPTEPFRHAPTCTRVQMCVLAGCDFVDSLPGIGIKKAHQHLRRTRCFLKVGATGWLLVASSCEQSLRRSCGLFSLKLGHPPRLSPLDNMQLFFQLTCQSSALPVHCCSAAAGAAGGARPAF